MSKYLTTPIEDGSSSGHAQLHDQNVSTDPASAATDSGSSLAERSALEGAAVTFSEEPASVTIRVSDNGESFEMTVAEVPCTVVINDVPYAFDTSDIIGKGPVILSSPTTAEDLPEDLSTLTGVEYVTAPYLYDPSGGAPAVTLSTLRGDEVLGDGAQYAPTDFDRIAGFSVRQKVVNGWGESLALSEIVAPLAHSPALLPFTATSALIKSDGIQPGGADSVLIVVNATLEDRTGTLFRDPSGVELRAYFSSGIGRAYASDVDAGRLLNFNSWYSATDPFETGDRICLMTYLRVPGYAQIALYRNGQLVRASISTRSTASAKIDTTNALTIGHTDFGSYKDYSIKGGYQDFRIWTDLDETPDISTSGIASCFLDDAGDAMNPAIANTRFGMPRIWLPTDPAQADALVNLGTAGNFTSKKGTFA